ncbi:MAG: hypothetical protein HY064_06680 [Bacteroidetes bacterium]|nr:hypothetical protein [Bacteroidota bacterium]
MKKMEFISYGTPPRKHQAFRRRDRKIYMSLINDFFEKYTNEKKVHSFSITAVTLNPPSVNYQNAIADIENKLTIIASHGNISGAGPEWEIASADFGKAVELLEKYLELEKHLLLIKIQADFTFTPSCKFLKPYAEVLKNERLLRNNNFFFVLTSIQAFWINMNFPFTEIGDREMKLFSEIESTLNIELKEKNFRKIMYDEKKDRMKVSRLDW